MKRILRSGAHYLAGVLMALLLCLAQPAAAGTVRVLQVAEVIGPASADFIVRGLAPAPGLEAVVIALDTPGGLDSSMRQIVQAILASPVPVITYVSPEGARAASAGTFILYASHIAAMTPASNLGAASPVAIGGLPGGGGAAPQKGRGDQAKDTQAKDDQPAAPTPSLGADTLARKASNDAIAYIRSLAELRHRNVDFAEKAVRDAASLSAEAALREGVIDVIAKNVPELLREIDGRKIETANGTRVLATADAQVETRRPGWRYGILALLANPQVAVVLMMIGFYGLFIEFTSPGFGVPGVAGTICLLLALFAFQLLPINWAGVALLGFGMVLMAAEVFMPSFGVLGVGGIVAFVLGGLFLLDEHGPGVQLSLVFLGSCAAAAAALILLVGTLFARSRRRPVASGVEEMPGSTGEVMLVDGREAWAVVRGERWQIESVAPLAPGMQVRVTAVRGLVLQVEPITSGSPT